MFAWFFRFFYFEDVSGDNIFDTNESTVAILD